jgi:hypothetical protein
VRAENIADAAIHRQKLPGGGKSSLRSGDTLGRK